MPSLEEGERTMSLIELNNTNISFASKGKRKGSVNALVDMNLTIEEGEILAVVGESGCGKTTLGKVIADIYKPTKGEVLYHGKNIL